MDRSRAEPPPGSPPWSRVLLFVAGYYVSGRVGLLFTHPPEYIAAVWPPAGVALVGALFLGRWAFPLIALAIFFSGTLWAAASRGDPLTATAVTAVGSVGGALRALLGAYLIRRVAPGPLTLGRTRVALGIVLAAVAASALSATIGVTARSLGGLGDGDFGERWLRWWLADTAGVLLVAPAVLAFRERPSLPFAWRKHFELLVLASTAALASVTVFGGTFSVDISRPLSATLLPMVAWPAFRFGPAVSSWMVLGLSGVAIWGATHGVGPFVAGTPTATLLLVQAFLVVLGATALVLSAEVQGRRDVQGRLEETTTLLRSVTEGTSDAVFVKDLAGRYLMINSAGAAYVGRGIEEVLGRTDDDLFAPEMARTIKERDRAILETGAVRTDEYEEFVGERRRTYLAIKGPCRDRQGRVTGVFGISRDITDRKLQRTLLTGILEGTHDIVSAVDRDFRVVAFNSALKREYEEGFGVELTEGARISEVLGDHPEELAQSLSALGRAFRGEESQGVWSIGKPRPGSRWYDVRASPLRDETGHVIGGSLIGRDITEMREAEAQLRGSEARFRALGLQAPVGIFETDAGGQCTFVNTRWCELTGLSKEEALGQVWSHAVHPDDLARVAFAWDAAIEKRGEFRAEYRLRRADGQLLWVSGVAAPVIDAVGRQGGWLGTVTDVTERRRSEEELRLHRDEIRALNERLASRAAALQTANRELESFSYSVSHDLRTPLRAIDGFTRALEEDYGARLDSDARGYIERVRRATHRMGQIIDDLLQLSRLARGELKSEAVDMTALAGEVDAALRAAQPDRAVAFEAAPGLRTVGDSRMLRLVLENLLGNAWKYTSRQPRARIEFGSENGGGEPVFFVRDDGAGFDMAYAGKLFGAFQRLHNASEFPGSGIGLATVARVVQRHGGRAWAEGAPGRGATFYFTLGRGANP
jgi:PAS domain S-box-containing protein